MTAVADITDDAFGSVLGTGRGSGRPDEPELELRLGSWRFAAFEPGHPHNPTGTPPHGDPKLFLRMLDLNNVEYERGEYGWWHAIVGEPDSERDYAFLGSERFEGADLARLRRWLSTFEPAWRDW